MTFPGENRAFGGSQLYVDLIPTTSWCRNARAVLSSADWTKVARIVTTRVSGCECCGAKAALEAHERWDYDGTTQRLVRLVALCRGCHEATHYGRALATGTADRARTRLRRVNDWSTATLERHLDSAFALCAERSRTGWSVDVTILANAGFAIRSR
jgi:hypothetical protein